MVPSSALCRAQESLHLRRATDTQLDNVRTVATNAAAAWAKEAVAAERREGRKGQARVASDEADDDDVDLLDASSENPDRGSIPAAIPA